MYSFYCTNCSNLFGCIGLKNKQYCIFNKEYSQKEYEELAPKIINNMVKTGEWGESFPIKYSPIGYNDTLAMEHFPITQEEAESKGYKWQSIEYPVNIPKGLEKIEASQIPDHIEDVDKSILNKAILCQETGAAYRLTNQELRYYQKYEIPVPRKHPVPRHLERVSLRNPRRLFDRKCDKCGIEMKTTYTPEREETVYCEECYIKEVY